MKDEEPEINIKSRAFLNKISESVIAIWEVNAIVILLD